VVLKTFSVTTKSRDLMLNEHCREKESELPSFVSKYLYVTVIVWVSTEGLYVLSPAKLTVSVTVGPVRLFVWALVRLKATVSVPPLTGVTVPIALLSSLTVTGTEST
jgi:hypothetical protein